VPAGYDNEEWYLGTASSGEHVKITPAGENDGQAQGAQVILYPAINGPIDLEAMAYKVADIIQRKGRGR
jgi:hypothetical protein